MGHKAGVARRSAGHLDQSLADGTWNPPGPQWLTLFVAPWPLCPGGVSIQSSRQSGEPMPELPSLEPEKVLTLSCWWGGECGLSGVGTHP